MHHDTSLESGTLQQTRRRYEEAMASIRARFEAEPHSVGAGVELVRARAEQVDALIRQLWAGVDGRPEEGISLVAVGGYGRRELLPYSDIDLMFLLRDGLPERAVQDCVGALSQALWDVGVRVSPMTRTLAECGRFEPDNVEFTLSLLDARGVAGDARLAEQLRAQVLPELMQSARRRVSVRLAEVTRTRHHRFGDTLFHLEPNVKECPGGLRDAHVCAWLARLAASELAPDGEFDEAKAFLTLVRAFLHLRHGRDDNTLDWGAQDDAAAARLGAERGSADPAFWMRLYFRHARVIERRVARSLEEMQDEAEPAALPSPGVARRGQGTQSGPGFDVRSGRIALSAAAEPWQEDPAHDPEVVFAVFAAMARNGARLPARTEERLADALPVLSANVEDGPVLWRHLKAVLTGPCAGHALRSMHALGILELVMPEFHGIDALVIRDAYHRYTVDEHTFVVIDTLHQLAGESDPWAARFAGLLRDLPHPELLYMAALLHDTGKGYALTGHALESERLARNVLSRLEIDPYEANMVLELIRNHLEMSAALRRDVFDVETVSGFGERVPTPELLRMLTLFTYADITAVHPHALTPWKAENLWRLYMATANFLDRNVDEERLDRAAEKQRSEVLDRVRALLPGRDAEAERFLAGLPRRYLLTRSPEQVRTHVEMAASLEANDGIALDFRYARDLSEMTLVTRDRPRLFAMMAGALAAWQMNIVTADAFSNAEGVMVDSFRFSDLYRTLELNEEERVHFVESVRDVISGRADLAAMLQSRRRLRRTAPKVHVETRVDFDTAASSHSTLLQVVAQDSPGLLRALSLTLAEHGCNIEVALVDTEGETAIDVFYVTRLGEKLAAAEQEALRTSLVSAIEANAGDDRQ